MQRGSWLAEAGLVGWAGFGFYVVVVLVAFWVTLKGRTLSLRIPLGILSIGTTIAIILIAVDLGKTSAAELAISVALNLLLVAGTTFRLYGMRKQQR